ncbi:endonuclease/exonuclease/phosphatase family protein [Marinospirillum sp.]|uniref:endonuclease/exonuclease/phosphatase family protein n=1 Tax=Marinospirillum sp. TaxID=2183934 RepID=UPI00286FE08A|nr:endonuclease/exonuclease/phosphatase family protein [Marinospirillum sp.]MDR9469114.1 Ada metal-binding domain-containing protein [Marinospirillum sp.]
MTKYFSRHWLASALVVFCVVFSGGSFAEKASNQNSNGLAMASWNIERLGHGSNKDYAAQGVIGSHFDFIAVQEAMTLEGLEAFQQALQVQTGESWEMLYSHRIGRSTYKEKYAFLWRPQRVEYLDGAVVYLDPGDLFAREPYSARFRDLSTGDEFAVATVHIVYGQRISDRTEEIEELARYWEWLHEIYPNTPVVLMGDFNLQPHHPAWQPLRQAGARPLITEGATTLSAVDGRYANLYDNIWIKDSWSLSISQVGIFQFPQLLEISHEQARRHISDHAPVYLLTASAQLRGAELSSYSLQEISPDLSADPPAETQGLMIGHKNSKILHRPDCPSYSRISEKNRVYFQSVQEGLDAGFRLAKNCP